MPVCWPKYSASRSVVQFAVSCPTAWGSTSITRSSSASQAAVTRRSRAFRGASRYGILSTREEPFEDTYDRVLATQHDLGDLA
jgi:hypothetical protein